MGRRDILARMAARAAERAREEIASRAARAVSSIRERIREIPGRNPVNVKVTPVVQPEPSREPEPPPKAPTSKQKVPEPEKDDDWSGEEEEWSKNQEEWKNIRIQPSEKGIGDALAKLRSLSEQTAEYVKQLESLGMGDAAQAVIGLVKRDVEVSTKPPEVIPILPIEPPPSLTGRQGTPPPDGPSEKPPKPPKPPQEPVQREDSPVLQGSRFYIPIQKRKDAFRALWDEWIRAGIGKPRVEGVQGDPTDAAGRMRGMVLSPEALEYLPRAEVIVPGRDGSLLVPGHIMVDEDAFNNLLDQWGIGERITIQVEGMYRADGPVVTKNTWFAPYSGDDEDE